MKKSPILKIFPLPKYLSMPAVGIDISDRSLKYVELREKNGGYFVSRHGTRIIPEGMIEDGQIKQKEKIVEFLKSINKELKIKFVNVSLPEEKAYLSKIKIPLVKDEDIRSSIEFQLEEHIPLPIDNIIFDFEVIKKIEQGKKDDCIYVNIAAFPKTLVESYESVFVEAGFMPLAFEVETQAFARAMVPFDEKGSCFLIDFGKTRTSFAIISDGKIQFTSTIKIGGNDLNSSISKNLGVDIFRADEIKKEYGMVRSKENEKVFSSILPLVSVIKDEINKHIIYWNSHLEDSNKEKEIKKIILCGGDSNLTGMPEYFSYELKIPTERGNPWINIVSFNEHVPEIEFKDSLIYVTAIGLSFRPYLNYD